MATVAELEKRLDRTDERISAIETSQSSMNEKMIRLDEKMNGVNNVLKAIGETMAVMSNDIKILMQQPAKKWDLVTSTAITAIVGGFIGFIVANILK